MARSLGKKSSLDRVAIRRPVVADLREAPAIAILREAGEVADDATRNLRAASSGLARFLVFLIVLPALALPALMTIGSSAPWYSGTVLAAYLPMILLALAAGHYLIMPEVRGKVKRRAERMHALEDTSILRRDLLRP